MKYVLLILIIFFTTNVFAQNIFNRIIIDENHSVKDSREAIEYINKKLNPKFPKDVQINIKNITLSGEPYKIISFYYSEYDGATRGASQFFISFWKDNKTSLICTGSNLLNIYDPVVTISNNIINIKACKLYEPLSVYYYSFIYERPKILFHSILKISTDGDNNTETKYYFSQKNSPVDINSIFADEFIKNN